MQTGSQQSCELMQKSIEDEDESNNSEMDKENAQPRMLKKAAASKRKRKLLSKVLYIMQWLSATEHK